MNDNGEPLVLSSELAQALRERDEARQERNAANVEISRLHMELAHAQEWYRTALRERDEARRVARMLAELGDYAPLIGDKGRNEYDTALDAAFAYEVEP